MPQTKPRKPKKYKPFYVGSQKLKKTRAWELFSQYIRRRDGRCFTCDSRKAWKELDAGHYIAGNVCGKSLFFSEIAVNAQCTVCNRFRHGNSTSYSLALIRKYGSNILETLDKIRREEKEKGIINRWTKEELKQVEEFYKRKLISLQEKNN